VPGTYIALLAIAVLVVVVVAIIYVAPVRRPRIEPADAPVPDPLEQRPLPAVVFNPTRFDDVATVHAQITKACTDLGWSEPLWLETSAEDPGIGQARTALAVGADLVLACGGDGTIRNVAQVLAGSGTALGLLPAGTGNLLARNLALQIEDPAVATRIALSGENRPVDVGRVMIDGGPEEQVFLVMAGMGFDAAIMAGAPARLKARVGPLAYFISGFRALTGPQLQGLQRAEYAVLLHRGDWRAADCYGVADVFGVSLERTRVATRGEPARAATGSMLAVEGAEVSALLRVPGGLVLRVFRTAADDGPVTIEREVSGPQQVADIKEAIATLTPLL
jgi:hypothetical protein